MILTYLNTTSIAFNSEFLSGYLSQPLMDFLGTFTFMCKKVKLQGFPCPNYRSFHTLSSLSWRIKESFYYFDTC